MLRVLEEAAAGMEGGREEVADRATKERRERVTDLTPTDAMGVETGSASP